VFRLKSHLHQLVEELKCHHRYLSLFLSAEEGSHAHGNRLLKVAEVLTVQTLLMFLLAILYDLQSPSDDGSCTAWTTKDTCLRRRSPLDPSQSYCSWSDGDADTSCSFGDLQMTVRGVLVIALLVSAITVCFLYPVEFLFDLLTAPTARRHSESNGADKKGLCRVSKEPLTRKFTSVALASQALTGHVISGTETRTLPETAAAAQRKARGALILLTSIHRASQKHSLLNDGNTDKEDDEYFPIVPSRFLSSSPEELFAQLVRDIDRQRLLLRPPELEEFDRQWGLDPATAAVTLKRAISGSIASTQRRSLHRIEQLGLASDQLRGLELLQLLVIDLLGRDSPAARIFEHKVEEDFRRLQVVTFFSKLLAVLVLVLLNVLFATYSVLYGFRQGLAWQRQYVSACVVQMFVEVFVNESLEVVWMHFLVPSLVAAEVQAACEQLLRAVRRLCEGNNSLNEQLLNAPSYLFVSRQVAAAYPHLLEAGIVQAVNSYLPGAMARRWHAGRGRETRGERVSVVWMGLAVGLSLLQVLGSAPFHLQRLLVRSVQPLFVSAVMLIYYLMADSPLLIIGFAAALAAAVGYGVVRYIQEGRVDRTLTGSVKPLEMKPLLDEESGLLYLHNEPLQLKKPDDGGFDGKNPERDHKVEEEKGKESVAVESSLIASSNALGNTLHCGSDSSDLFEISAESSLCSDSSSNFED